MDVLSDLHVFRAVVDANSFVKAAEHLGLSSSAISKRISRYEARLETRLLNRTTRALSLTEAGQLLYHRAQTILEEVEQAELESRGRVSQPSGNLRIACSDAFAMYVLVPALASFRKQYPGVDVTILQGDGVVDMIRERIDVAVRFEPPRNAEFVSRSLIADPWVICAAPSYLQQFGYPDTPHDLRQHQCLNIRARDVENDRWQFRIEDKTQTLTIHSVFSGIGAVVKEAALSGMGIARLAQFLVKDDIERGDLVRLLAPFELENERYIHAVYPHRAFVPLKVKLIVSHLRDHLVHSSLHQEDPG